MGLNRSRSAEFSAYADAADMRIIVASRDEPLLAHYHVLRQLSTCVRDLPRAANSGDPLVWDLRNLVLEGEVSPVSAEVVQRWLDLVYSRLDAGRRVRRINELDGARPLLAFADACGTSQVIIDEIGRRLLENPDLGMDVSVGEGPQRLTVRLGLRDETFYASAAHGLSKVHAGRVENVIDAGTYAPHASAFPTALCYALESWLHLAGRLGMVPLCRALVDFIKAQLVVGTASPAWLAISSIFSRRVLEFMPRELLYEALVRDSLLVRPAGVKVEGKGVKVTLNSPLAAAWFIKPLGATESMELDGTALRSAQGTHAPVHVVLGGVVQSAAARIVEEVVQKACEEAE